MKKSHRWAMLAAAIAALSYLILPALAQQPGPQQFAGRANFALLDVNKIFKNHARFKAMREEMMGDVQRAEQAVKAEKENITKAAEELQQLNKGTPDYKQKEEELAKRQADLSVKVTLQKNQFLQREAEIYYSVYQEISQATEYFATQHHIDVVLRFNGDPADVQQPQSILSYINKPVVFQQKDLDITGAIMMELNRSAGNPAAANRDVPMRPGVQFPR